MRLFWTAVLLLGLSASATRGQDQNTQLPLTVDVATTSTIRLNRDLVQYSGYYFDVVFYENGTLKDLTGLIAKIQAKKVENVYPPVDEFLFQDDGTVFDGESRAEFPVQPGYLGTNSVGNVRFELQLLTGTSVDVRVQLDSYVIPGVATGNEQEYVPPDPIDNYYTKGEVDSLLTYMAEWNQDETWNDLTKVGLYDAVIGNTLLTSSIGDNPDSGIFDDIHFVSDIIVDNGYDTTFNGEVYFNDPISANNVADFNSTMTIDGYTTVNNTLDVTGANIIGNLVQNDVFEVKTPAAQALAAEASPLAVAGSMVFDDPVIFNSNVTANASLSVGDMTVGNLTGSTDPWTLTGAGDIVLDPGPSTGSVDIWTTTANEGLKIMNATGTVTYWDIGSDNGFPAINIPTSSTYASAYLIRNPPPSLSNVFWGLGATSAHRYRIYGGVDDGSSHLQIGDTTARTYQRLFASGAPLAIGSNDPADASTPASGDIIFTNPVFAESTVDVTSTATFYGNTYFDNDSYWQDGGVETVRLYEDTGRIRLQLDNTGTWGGFTITKNATTDYGYAYFGNATAAPEGWGFRGAGVGRPAFCYQNNRMVINDYSPNFETGYENYGLVVMNTGGAPGGAYVSGDLYVGGVVPSPMTFDSTAVFNGAITANSDLTVDGNLDVSLHAAFNGTVGDLTFAAGNSVINGTGGDLDIVTSGSLAEYVNIRSRALRVWDRDDTDYIQFFGQDGGKSFYISANANNPATDPVALQLFPNASGLGGDKGLTLISWNANIGDARPGLEGCQYRWYIPRADGTSSTALQLGATTSEDWLRLTSTNTATPILFGSGTLSGTVVTDGDDVGFTKDVQIEGDLEVMGEIIVNAGSTDAKITYSYTPGGLATDEILVQFGTTVLTGGSITVPLGIAYKDTNYVVMATYEATTTTNWDAIGYQIVDVDHVTFTGETGQTITYQTTGFITP